MPRTKPAVRVHLSIAHHPKTADLWATRDGRAVLVETMRLAAERFAGKRGNRVQLLPADRLSIACTDMISSVFDEVGWGVRRLGKDGRRWEVSLRNFARKQGFGGEESDTFRGVSRERMSASESESESESESKSEERERAPSAPRSPARVNGSGERNLIEKPHSFPPDSMDRIRAWAGRKGYDRGTLNAGLDLFRDWEPLRDPERTIEQWESAFKRVTRDGVAEGKIAKTGDAAKPKGQAYAEWTGYDHEVAP